MTGVSTRPWNVLLVDDDPLVVKVYAERMRFEGWSVSVARDGWEASQEVRRTAFDIILLDIRMPYHSGVEVLKDIRERDLNAETPVYLLTSLSPGTDVDDALRLGADGVFYKCEVRPDDLVTRVSRILGAADGVQAEAEDFVASFGGEFGGGEPEQEAGEGPDAEEAPARAAPGPEDATVREVPPVADDPGVRRIVRDYEVFINPFLADGSSVFQVLELPEGTQCPDCGGQVCLRLSPAPAGAGGEVVGTFLCSRCKKPV